MPRKIASPDGVRSPKSREFGCRLTLPQVRGALKLLSVQSGEHEGVAEWDGKELDSLDSLERRLKDLYLSITGDEYG